MAKHAYLSASASERWLKCPPSAKLCAQEEDRGSPYGPRGRYHHGKFLQLPVRLHYRGYGDGAEKGVLYGPAVAGAAEAERSREQHGFFRVEGGAKALRKAAAKLAAATGDRMSFYLEMPVREFVELNNEAAEAWGKARR